MLDQFIAVALMQILQLLMVLKRGSHLLLQEELLLYLFLLLVLLQDEVQLLFGQAWQLVQTDLAAQTQGDKVLVLPLALQNVPRDGDV